MNTNYIHVFTDADLDGAISYLTLCWFIGKDLPVTVTTEKAFGEDFKKFSLSNDINNYTRIYVLDLDICSYASQLDKPNFSIVDHHFGSIECGYNFKHARHKIEDSGSTCKLLYNVLKNHYNKDIDASKKLLVSIGHDYDSYTLKNRELSIGLNMLFWNLQGNRLEKFKERYKNGFKEFTNEDLKIISFYKNKINKHLQDNHIFSGIIPMGGKNVKVSSVFADFCINEVAQEVITRTNSEVAIIVNPKTESVSFRKASGSDLNMAKLAAKIAEGGGHPSAAGGKITESFMEFTKLLK